MSTKEENIIGQKFNRLTVLSIEYKIMPNGKKRKFYKCWCDCGKITLVRSDQLKNNHTTSCGCAKINLLIKNTKEKQTHNLVGQKFGKLTVIEQDNTPSTRVKWICRCDCGNKISVFATNLVRLHTTSCGCVKRSIGEENIENLLKKHNINYIKEYGFDDLKNIKKLRFDFAIFNNDNQLIELIEFDGRQHNNDYTPWNNDETLLERQERDKLKDNYCKEKNIKLIRIPYEKRDNITLKDLELI